MLFAADSISLMHRITYQWSSGRVWKLQNRTKVIRTLKYADDVVLLVKEEMVLLAMIKRLIEIGRCYGMEMNVEKLK
jgi:hypothetical protein